MSEQVLITLIQTIGGIVLAHIAYLRLRAGQAEQVTRIDENTAKTVEIGVAVNGRVEALVEAKVAALELAYKTENEALKAQLATMQTALDLATKKAEDTKPCR